MKTTTILNNVKNLMRGKKAFTLIELLAVIAILAIILLIAVPKVINTINSAKQNALESDAIMILKAIDIKQVEDETFDPIDITEENIESLLGISGDNYEDLFITEGDEGYEITIVGDGTWDGYTATGTIANLIVSVTPVYADNSGANAPELITGLLPVKWDGSNWVKADFNNLEGTYEWYDYDSKMWANAVTVKESGTKTRTFYQEASAGEIININDINTMWVWIPRYAYQIATNYHTGVASTINIKFLKNTTNTTYDNETVATVPTYSGTAQTNYVVSKAFRTYIGGSTYANLSVIWFAKFEPNVSIFLVLLLLAICLLPIFYQTLLRGEIFLGLL